MARVPQQVIILRSVPAVCAWGITMFRVILLVGLSSVVRASQFHPRTQYVFGVVDAKFAVPNQFLVYEGFAIRDDHGGVIPHGWGGAIGDWISYYGDWQFGAPDGHGTKTIVISAIDPTRRLVQTGQFRKGLLDGPGQVSEIVGSDKPVVIYDGIFHRGRIRQRAQTL
ncbi:Jacalin-type lectin domain-containing protein [Plasmodiophora brassicae]|uniref:Uncharacterized protein n=1 Tax=Plasmodiophora brassicae TaxID=37360 RepID=A0A0G4IJY8_PLABS|nr:hypothetical protein PBRA_009667 [Plasmodiophora brassicae]SPQ99126.1 unnamed protein product [Plasmodiophora brassicae]